MTIQYLLICGLWLGLLIQVTAMIVFGLILAIDAYDCFIIKKLVYYDR